jgi:hypothetical protein
VSGIIRPVLSGDPRAIIDKFCDGKAWLEQLLSLWLHEQNFALAEKSMGCSGAAMPESSLIVV